MFKWGGKSHSRLQMEAEIKANPRSKGNKTFGKWRGIVAGSEDEIQATFFEWIDSVKGLFPQLESFHAVPNGTHTTKTGRWILILTGRRPGVPDTHLPERSADGQFVGLYIEFKRPGQYATPEQKVWHERLRASGHRVEVHKSWIDAANLTIEYLNLPLEKIK